MRFEDQDEATRVALTEAALHGGRAMVERWSKLTLAQSQTWEYRARYAAQQLAGCSSVVDVGCGQMLLERHLRSWVSYVPVDIVPRDHRTVVADLNSGPLPASAAGEAVAVLGVLEYLHDPRAFVGALSQRFRSAVIAYCTTDLTPDLTARRANGWISDLSRRDLEELFGRHGLTLVSATQIDPMQCIWHLVATPESRARQDIIFVGGTGRSGTSSLLEALAKSAGFTQLYDYESRFLIDCCGLVDLFTSFLRPIAEADLRTRLGLFRSFVHGDGRVLPHFQTSRARSVFGERNVDRALDHFCNTLLDGVYAESDRRELFQQAADRLMQDLFRPDPGQIIVEKTPYNSVFMPQLKAIFPSAKFLMSFREPRGTIRSYMRHQWEGSDPRAISRLLGSVLGNFVATLKGDRCLLQDVYVLDVEQIRANVDTLSIWLSNRFGARLSLNSDAIEHNSQFVARFGAKYGAVDDFHASDAVEEGVAYLLPKFLQVRRYMAVEQAEDCSPPAG